MIGVLLAVQPRPYSANGECRWDSGTLTTDHVFTGALRRRHALALTQ